MFQTSNLEKIMNKWLWALLIVNVTVLTLSLSTNKLMAQNKNFTNVIAFASNNGRLGFFDQNNGKIYIYDSNLKDCTLKAQLDELGKPLKRIPINSILQSEESTTTNTTQPSTQETQN